MSIRADMIFFLKAGYNNQFTINFSLRVLELIIKSVAINLRWLGIIGSIRTHLKIAYRIYLVFDRLDVWSTICTTSIYFQWLKIERSNIFANWSSKLPFDFTQTNNHTINPHLEELHLVIFIENICFEIRPCRMPYLEQFSSVISEVVDEIVHGNTEGSGMKQIQDGWT